MNVWSLPWLLAAWAAMSLLNSVLSSEVTVRHKQLKLCPEDNRMCVSRPTDCTPPPPSSVQKSLNMSCYYQDSPNKIVSCVWSPESTRPSDATLIFSRQSNITSCRGIFNLVSVLNVTVRTKDVMGVEIWSQPHTLNFTQAEKPSQPVLTVLDSVEDSLVVSWMSSHNGSCQLHYRLNNTLMWTQAPDDVSVVATQEMKYTIRDLLPFRVYRVAVACRSQFDVWSDWSSEDSGMTWGRAPSQRPDVCYRVEKSENTSAPREAGCPVLGYQVSKEPGGFLRNVTESKATLVAEEGTCSVAVKAFNMAGYGPAAHLRIDPQHQNTVRPIRSMWVSSLYPDKNAFLIQWETAGVASSSALFDGHFVIQLHSETKPSSSRWAEVDGFNTSTTVQVVDPDESFLITVFPVSKQQYGRPRSLSASLQRGALMGAVDVKIVNVTRTTVTVKCVWVNESQIRVTEYRAVLKTNSHTGNVQTVFLWPQQMQHTFFNLTPNTEYSLSLLADNFSRAITPVTTEFDEHPAVATVTPLLLLAVTVLIISILSRTVYKSYFVPYVSSPQGSTTGQWLMNTNLQKSTQRHILDIQDFQVTDMLGEKSLIMLSPNRRLSFEEGLAVKLSTLRLDADCVRGAPQSSEYKQFQMHEANGQFPRDNGENDNMSRQIDAAVKRHLDQLLADSHCVQQMVCEAEYLVNTPLLGETEVEAMSRQSDCTQLICEAEYIDNNCFMSKAEDKDWTHNFCPTEVSDEDEK
ncbi:uncharacterized protein LOC125012211 isoform X2 [Mugil cephalus]|uniref:uncharacterized protein LOC125012211 isoform X2 n=1 Tax=Mugil cephalus TaxID=48193 RepID=UPI001FB6900E|nr:uncharacterized protein LOC125012211 isoform X2 [Mugil cephalus]